VRSRPVSRLAAPAVALLLVAATTPATAGATATATAAEAPAAAASASASEPWSAAQTIRDRIFAARADALLHPDRAAVRARAAADGLSGPLRRGLAERARPELRQLRAALAGAERAAAARDPLALAAASGSALAALRRGAFKVTVAETRAGRVRAARKWLLVRDFREATRFTRPAVDATVALDDLQAGEIEPREAVVGVRKDLLDTYQARLGSYLDDARLESERGYLPAAAESAALAAGYWRILAPVYEHQRGAPARAEVDAVFERLTPLVGRPSAFRQGLDDAGASLKHFRAAPLTPEEKARRATQLIRFLDLVPIEYDHGTDDGHVTIAFELQEALAFADGADSALTDLAPTLEKSEPRALAGLEASIARLTRLSSDAHERRRVAPLEEVEAERDHAAELIEASFPEEWREPSDEADFDLIQISLDQMEAAVSAGQKRLAEQARLSAYAFFEFGPEIKLSAFDPGLVTEVEGLIWYGARGRPGLAELIADGREPSDVRDTRLVLNEALEEAKATTGEGASTGTVVTNAALIVFREGLEAILIIAAITASMVGANRPLRRPVLRGALLALPASAVLFVVAELLLESLSRYGEKLEAVVGLVAIGVLLLVLNWFFHRVYWTEWIAGHRKRGKALLATGGVTVGTLAGLYLVGFTSVFREGFETVLFLQALQLSSGTGIVLAGVSLGLVATAAVGVATFALERRLPYKRMLVVTGVLIALVLFVLMGNTMRTLQGVGWIGITPIDVELPLWMGTWLGVYPTVETLTAQFASLAFVVGSYYAAELVRKRPRGRAAPPGPRPESNGGAPPQIERDVREPELTPR
jgi:high-affinity iron transporter